LTLTSGVAVWEIVVSLSVQPSCCVLQRIGSSLPLSLIVTEIRKPETNVAAFRCWQAHSTDTANCAPNSAKRLDAWPFRNAARATRT
jgi:hypothetical protein